MAEVLVSAILEELAFVVRQQTVERVRLIGGVDEEVVKLTSNFQAIQALLNDAERKQVKEEAVRYSLDKLQGIAYDIDDFLDEWNTMIGKLQIKEVENASKPLRKVRSLIPYYLCCCTRFVSRYDIAIKIKDLNRKLDAIALEKDRFGFSLTRGPENLEREMTTSFGDLSMVYGREHDKTRLVGLLMSESSQGSALPIISIIGVGGIGKTTLARLAFRDVEVKTHFEKLIWVCVSDPFDQIRIAKAILESLNDTTPNVGELEPLLQQISQSLGGKKYLLVLDDVWIEESKYWEPLRDSLDCGSRGSRILVTTRKEPTAKVMGTSTSDTISIGVLSDQESWTLFSQVALSQRTTEEFQNLEYIGRKIVEKCKGLPLAIKTLGSLLRLKNKTEEWERVLISDLWELEEIEKGLFPPLLLSYYDLPFPLRKCFSYCAIFPKDYYLSKDDLIKLWMAQGYLKSEKSIDIEFLGERYFEELAIRSFFQDFERREDDNSIERCKMHDIVHDFAQFLSKNECFMIETNDNVVSQLQFSNNKARHFMVAGNTIPTSTYNENKLRSFIVGRHGWELETDLPELFDKLTCLRTLNLSSCSIEEIPSGIKNLMHLRYLNLSSNKFKELPVELCYLYNLQTLDLNYCDHLEKLPEGIDKLINLRHLENYWTLSLKYMPRGMEKMTNLRRLDKLVMSSDSHGRNKAYSLDILKNLNSGGGRFALEGLGNVSEVKAVGLKSMKNLRALTLSFDKMDVKRSMSKENEAILEALQPPPNLVELWIEYYEGKTISPVWMVSLTNLRELTLYDIHSCESLPTLGNLLSLESLSIRQMWNVKQVGNEILGIELELESGGTITSSIILFPKLKKLFFWDMEEWEEWNITKSRDEGITIMPCLESLKIHYCPKLKAVPDHILQLTTLRELFVSHCSILYSNQLGKFSYRGNTIFPNMTELTLSHIDSCESLPPLGNLLSLESLRIRRMKNVKQVGNEILGIELELESGGTITSSSIFLFPKLKYLRFECMFQWEDWNITNGRDEGITIMPCLQSLNIYDCRKLKAVPDQILRKPTLQTLEITRCPILERRYQKEGKEWCKISHIPYIDIPRHPIDDSESSNSSVVAHSAQDDNQGGDIDSE